MSENKSTAYTSESYNYVARQLRVAVEDAPGGEKAWVPIRRSLAVTILEHLEDAAWVQTRLAWGRAMMTNLLDPTFRPQPPAPQDDVAYDVVGDACAFKALDEPTPWKDMNRQLRIRAIQDALTFGETPEWMPDKRTWRRHYPEAFTTNGEEVQRV